MNRILIKSIITIALFLSLISVTYACDTVSIELNYYGIVKPKGSETYYYAYLEATVISGYADSWDEVSIQGNVSYEPRSGYDKIPGGPGVGKYGIWIWSDVAGDNYLTMTANSSSPGVYDYKTCNFVVNEVGSISASANPPIFAPETEAAFTAISNPSCGLIALEWYGRYREYNSSEWGEWGYIGNTNPLSAYLTTPGIYQALAKNGSYDDGVDFTIYVVDGDVWGEYEEIDSETGMDLYYEILPSYGWSYSEGSIYLKDEWENVAYSTPITTLSGTIEWDGMGNQGCYDEIYLPPGPYDLGINFELPNEDIIDISNKKVKVKPTTLERYYAGFRIARGLLPQQLLLGVEAKIKTRIGKLSGEDSAEGNDSAFSIAYVNLTRQTWLNEPLQWAQTGFIKRREPGTTNEIVNICAEVVDQTQTDPLDRRWVKYHPTITPVDSTTYKYRCQLDKTTNNGQWDFYVDNDAAWEHDTKPEHIDFWEHETYCETAIYTGEIRNKQDDMPGTENPDNKCEFRDCKVYNTNTSQWETADITWGGKRVTYSSEWGAEGPVLGTNTDWINIWDKKTLPTPPKP